MAEREIVELVRGIPLFSALEDKDIQALADAFQREEYPRYATVYRQGEVLPVMYVVASGAGALLKADQEGVERRVGNVERGDVLGAMSLFTDDDRDVTLLIMRESALYSLSRDGFQAVTAAHPHITEALSFEGRADLRQRIEAKAEARRFPWLRVGENTVLCTRRHVWAFQRKVILSALLAVVALLFQVVFWFVPELAYLSGPALALAVLLPLLLIGFFYLDWRNDYFVVTNQRVVHEERVFAFLGRQVIYQASLRNIQNVNIDQEGFYARSFDFGDVIIDTAGPEGSVIFDMVPAPSKYRDVIMDLHYRAETRTVAERRAEMRREIEERLGKPLHEQGTDGLGEGEPALPADAELSPLEPGQPDQVLRNLWRRLQDYLLPQIRFERGGTVTYRKHWVVLFQVIWQPTAVLLLLLILLTTRLLHAWPAFVLPLEQAVSPLGALLIFLMVLPAILFWWWWSFEDWRNDLYQVTPNSVVDAKRNPLFFGEKRELQAPLANVQNVKAETMGFIGRLFKLGKVVIQTAGAEGTLEWEYVYNPSAVAEDVSRRVRAFIMRQEEARDLEQADVLADWFALYHQTTHPDDYASGESSPAERYRVREEEPQEEAAPDEDYPLY